MYKNQLTFLAIAAFLLSLILTGLGGWSDMLGQNIVFTKQHAWNDGIFMMLIALFLLLLAKF
jgi:hypothetical protein